MTNIAEKPATKQEPPAAASTEERTRRSRRAGREASTLVRDRAQGRMTTRPTARRKKGYFKLAASLRQQIRETHERRRNEPGTRGWPGAGGGAVRWLETPTEWVTTSMQACGLWPWIVGHAIPPVGTPLGRHLENGQWVCADPISWFIAGWINAPTAFVIGRPGLGKSSLMRHIIGFVGAYGVLPVVMSDTRPDYVGVIRAMEGQVIALGPGQKHLNVLDPGPLADYLADLAEKGETKAVQECLARVRSQRLNSLSGLLEIADGERLGKGEKKILAKAIDILDAEFDGPGGVPVIADLRELIESRHAGLRPVVGDHGDDRAYDQEVKSLLSSLMTIDCDGVFGDTFGRRTDERIDLNRPVVFDVSAIDEDDVARLGAVQFLTWTQATQALTAAKYLAEAGLIPQHRYLMVGDELYRALRALPEIVHRVDQIIRMIRKLQAGLILCTHTMNDLNLDGPDGPKTEVAWGFVERSDMCFLGGLSRNEMGNLKTVWDMSEREQDDVTGWSDLGSVDPESGSRAAPPGRAKFLLKLGKSPGIPFQGVIADIEHQVGDTNKDWESLREQLLGRHREVAA